MDSMREATEKHKARMTEPAPEPTRMAREFSAEELAAHKEGSEYLLRTGRLHPDHADLFLP